VEIAQCQPKLAHVVLARSGPHRFSVRLHGWQKQSRQDPDDRDHDQELDQGEPSINTTESLRHFL